jgi:replicative DNA helicase
MTYHNPDELIPLYPHGFKRAAKINVGDQIMGYDSKPREVLAQRSAIFGPLYELITKRFKIKVYLDEKSKLSLKRTSNKLKGGDKNFVDIDLCDYMGKSKTFKKQHSLFLNKVSYPLRRPNIDPYFMGLLLGDGSLRMHEVGITTKDHEILDEIYKQAEIWSSSIYCGKEACTAPTYWFRDRFSSGNNLLLSEIRKTGMLGSNCYNKYIPELYLFNTYDNRKELLSGLIDSDGTLENTTNGKTCYRVTTVSEQLAKDTQYLSRSLGFSSSYCTSKPKNKKWEIAYKVYIRPETGKLPIHIDRKAYLFKKPKIDTSACGFDISRLPDKHPPYYGFVVSGDGKYLGGSLMVLNGLW